MRLSRPACSIAPAFAFALALPLVSCRDGEAPASKDRPTEPRPSLPSSAMPALPSGALQAPSAQAPAAESPAAHAKDEMLMIIRRRVSQVKPKMKLTPEEGRRAESYLRDLASMPQCGLLSRRMPKTALELLRALNERGIPRTEAEAISGYLARLHDSMKMRNPGPFDENTSHVIGRGWHEIDYSGEGMSWQSQKRFYSRHGIDDLRTAQNVRKLFALESTFPYFRKIYEPEGKLPDF